MNKLARFIRIIDYNLITAKVEMIEQNMNKAIT